MLQNQALAIEEFQSKWQMAGQDAHAFIARTRSQSEDFVRAELTAVQRFEDSLQRQYDGQLRSHVHAIHDECREHVGQEEDKMRKEPKHVLTQESSMCHDQLQQALRHQVSQEEYADAAAHQETEQLKQLISQQAEAMKRYQKADILTKGLTAYAHEPAREGLRLQVCDGLWRCMGLPDLLILCTWITSCSRLSLSSERKANVCRIHESCYNSRLACI